MKPAICTQCGGTITVDETKEAGICQCCGMPFITEKAINNYITQNVHNVTHNVTENVTKIIYGQEKDEGSDFFNRGLTLLELEDWVEACDAFNKAKKRSPQRAEYWFYSVVANSKNFTTTKSFFHDEYDRSYGNEYIYTDANKFFKLASDADKKSLGEKFGFNLTDVESLVADIYDRATEKDDYVVGYALGKGKWTTANKDVFNRLYKIALDHNRHNLLFKNYEEFKQTYYQLLNDEVKEQFDKHVFSNSVYRYGDMLTVKNVDCFLKNGVLRVEDKEASRLRIDLFGYNIPTIDKLVITPNFKTFECVYMRTIYADGFSNISIREIEFEEGCSVSEQNVVQAFEKQSASLVRLPKNCEKLNVTVSGGWDSIIYHPTEFDNGIKVKTTDSIYTVGSVIGNVITYPSIKNKEVWKRFNSNLVCYFKEEIENGTFKGFVSDADLEAGVNPLKVVEKKNKEEKKGFFSKLFGKGK